MQLSGTTKEIECRFGNIEIINDNQITISEFAAFGPKFVEQTDDLSLVEAVLSIPYWDEDMLNVAIAELNYREQNPNTWGGPLRHIVSV